MAYKLQEYPVARQYSVLERQLFGMIPQNRQRISNNALLLKRKEAGPWSARYPRSIISVTMVKLIEKVLANKEPFAIERTVGHRHQQVYYWIVPASEHKELPKPEPVGKRKVKRKIKIQVKAKVKRKVKRKPTVRRSPAGSTRIALLD